MDQVPESWVGFTRPWHHVGARGEAKQQTQPQRGTEFTGLWAESFNKPVELPKPKNEIAQPLQSEAEEARDQVEEPKSSAEIGARRWSGPRVNKSRRQTKCMPVDLAPAGPQQNSEAPIRLKRLSSVSQEILLAQGHGGKIQSLDSASIRRVNGTNILSSRRDSGHHSSRSLCIGPLLEETMKNNPPHLLPQPPESDGIVHVTNTNRLPQLRVGNPNAKPRQSHLESKLSKVHVLGGSSRVTHSRDTIDVREPAPLPASPRKESNASKLLKKLKLSGTRSGVGDVIGTKSGKRSRSGGKSQHQKFGKSLEPWKSGITNGVRALTIHSECIVGGENGAHLLNRECNGAAASGEHAGKRSGSRWLFKWKWGAKAFNAPDHQQSAEGEKPRTLSPTAEIMSDVRDSFYTSKSDRYSSRRVSGRKSLAHKRGSSWGCASLAVTAAVTPIRSSQRKYSRIHQDDNDAGATIGSRVESMDRDGDHESFRSLGNSFRSARGQSFRRGELVFEDCHGSFRSIASGGSCSSFRCVEKIEWDSHLPPPLLADQTLTIGDIAALCNSSLKFVFKCREVQHFNQFLRSQKSSLLRAGTEEKGNTDRFQIIFSGAEIEVSSMVAALAYAWFLDNTILEVTGETWHAVPVIDMPRHQMHKHKSAAWLFDACGIDPAALLYADEIRLASLVAAGLVKTSTIGQDVLVTKNEGEKLVAEAQCLLEPRYMKTLLLAGVLLDTENLDFASMRDTEMITTLLVGSGSLGRNGFFDQLREVEEGDRLSKFISRNYGDGKHLSGRKTGSAALKFKIQQEAGQEQSDKDSLVTHNQDQTSTSEAGTNSSLDEDSPRLKPRLKYAKLPPHSAPARSHQLPSPARCNQDGKAVGHTRKAATQFVNSKLPAGRNRSPSVSRIRK